ncbi:MAG: pantoate--beta-alanine ligase [Sphingomonas sp.]|uniref:pantoate--beta-alanine ligase n=1 Tax=Sphingomonas sp. TaxID=28214 RepID=UPI0035A87CAC|nr:pantoate--beta-alanine ligase [Sphingomonas sp.]
MQTIRQLQSLRETIAALRLQAGRESSVRIALVPTMGALHAGHIALIEAAKRVADIVVASIFVNPRQFAPNEDLGRYPRREVQDSRMLAEAGCAILWMPGVEEIYPAGFATTIVVAGVSDGLDGAARPGHFDGVATVVTKLFNQVRPDVALFGEKDFQQLAVIRRLVADLDLPIEIVGVPTQREDDGLALSSRNIYLAPEDRARAIALPRALGEAARVIGKGGDPAGALAVAKDALIAGGFDTVDYVALVDAETLEPTLDAARPRRLLAAATIAGTRLIDNVAVAPTEG